MICERAHADQPAIAAARGRLLDALASLPVAERLGRDFRLATPVSEADATALLASTGLFPQALFASSRSGRRVCAFGAARAVTLPSHASAGELVARARGTLAPGTGPLIGAARFAPARIPERVDSAWDRFGAGIFFLPRVLLEERGGAILLAVHLCGTRPLEEERAAASAALRSLGAGPDDRRTEARFGLALPDERARFVASVDRALACLAEGDLEKVVLARRAERVLPEPRVAIPRALAILEGEPSGASYFLALSPDDAWLGSSPELLLGRHGDAVWSEAVAGTRPRGGEPDEDASLAAELLGCDKEVREHRLVRDHVEHALRSLGCTPRVSERPEVRRFSRVMHLVSSVEAKLPEGVSDGAVVDALHPTPAVAGVPTGAALRFIEECEGFDRGLYAGPVGILDEDGVELWVGLRGARLSRGVLTAFAGAGIVTGSDPETEWYETETKAGTALAALEGER